MYANAQLYKICLSCCLTCSVYNLNYLQNVVCFIIKPILFLQNFTLFTFLNNFEWLTNISYTSINISYNQNCMITCSGMPKVAVFGMVGEMVQNSTTWYSFTFTFIFIHIQHKYSRSRIYSFTFNINIYVHKYIHSTTYAPVSTYSIRQNTIYIVNNSCIYKHLYTLKKTLYHLWMPYSFNNSIFIQEIIFIQQFLRNQFAHNSYPGFAQTVARLCSWFAPNFSNKMADNNSNKAELEETIRRCVRDEMRNFQGSRNGVQSLLDRTRTLIRTRTW